MTAVEIALGLRIKVVVGQGKPGAKRRVIIADARDVAVIGINVLRAERRRLAALRSAPGHRRRGGKAAD